MESEQPSFRQLLPTFIIPVGSQVVLKAEKAGPDNEVAPRGAVGVVVESPTENCYGYTVQFANGMVIKAYFKELALRRREVEDELVLTGEDLRPFIIYRCQVGSRAFGLATDDSDDDIRGVYLPPARLHWSLFRLPEQLEFELPNGEEVFWEVEKYLKLALKGNPNVLETLWTPLVLHAEETARRLLDMREVFLSKYLYKTYSGYVLSQFRRMANAVAKKGTYKPKHAMHLIRMLHSGIEAMRHGYIRIDVAEWRAELLEIKAGSWPLERAKQRALDLDREFQEAYRMTRLPDQPDYRRVNDFLIWARRRMVDA